MATRDLSYFGGTHFLCLKQNSETTFQYKCHPQNLWKITLESVFLAFVVCVFSHSALRVCQKMPPGKAKSKAYGKINVSLLTRRELQCNTLLCNTAILCKCAILLHACTLHSGALPRRFLFCRLVGASQRKWRRTGHPTRRLLHTPPSALLSRFLYWFYCCCCCCFCSSRCHCCCFCWVLFLFVFNLYWCCGRLLLSLIIWRCWSCVKLAPYLCCLFLYLVFDFLCDPAIQNIEMFMSRSKTEDIGHVKIVAVSFSVVFAFVFGCRSWFCLLSLI